MMQFDADIGVVGLGAFGSNALWRLAERGISVIGFERHSIGHDQGSSHGETRLFRMISVEHPGLIPLAMSSIALFRELEGERRSSLLDLTGGVMMGLAEGPLITGILGVAEHNSLEHEVLTAEETITRFPQHHTLGRDCLGIVDPMSGILRPEAAIVAACDAATTAGAQVLDRTTVRSVDVTTGGVTINTVLHRFHFEQVVLTAGCWLNALMPGLPLVANRVPMLWYPARDEIDASEFDLDRFPVFQREVVGGHRLWGHGRLDGMDVKLGSVGDTTRDRRTDPDLVDRGTSPGDWRYVSSMAATELPGLAPIPSRVLPCMTTTTPDNQYVVGRWGTSRILVGGGGNAHGFKHCSGIGEILASQAVGEPVPFDVGFVDPNRFEEQSVGVC